MNLPGFSFLHLCHNVQCFRPQRKIKRFEKTHAPECLIRQSNDKQQWRYEGKPNRKNEMSFATTRNETGREPATKWQNVIQRKSMHGQPNGC